MTQVRNESVDISLCVVTGYSEYTLIMSTDAGLNASLIPIRFFSTLLTGPQVVIVFIFSMVACILPDLVAFH